MIEDAIPPNTTHLYNRLNLRIKLQQLQENTFHRIVGLRPAFIYPLVYGKKALWRGKYVV